MRKVLLFAILLVSLNLEAQDNNSSQFILRSTTSIAGGGSVSEEGSILMQSVGQASVIGTYHSGGFALRQGYVQALVWSKIVNSNEPIDLRVKIFPNPFVDQFNLSFLEDISEPVHVTLFNDLGQELKSVTYDPAQDLSMNLDDLAEGKYFVNVSSNGKQFVNQIVKLKE